MATYSVHVDEAAGYPYRIADFDTMEELASNLDDLITKYGSVIISRRD